MRIIQGFIGLAFLAGAVTALAKGFILLVHEDPKAFGLEGLRVAAKLQYGIEFGILVSIGLVCLGLLGGQSRRRYGYDRDDD